MAYLSKGYPIGERRACGVIRCGRSTYRYRIRQNPHTVLRQRIRDLAHARVRYGYRKILVLLKREGWTMGKKLVYRLYCEEGLRLRRRPPRRRKAAVPRQARFQPTGPNQVWSMDFVADQLADGRRFRALTILDVFTRESIAIEVGQRLRGEQVVATLNRLHATRGAPKVVFCDNGSEFTSHIVDLWAYHHQVKIDFSRPGKPTDNAYVESFNGTLRMECLNTHWFTSMEDAKGLIEAWRREYNESRPHRALKDQTPTEFANAVAAKGAIKRLNNAGN